LSESLRHFSPADEWRGRLTATAFEVDVMEVTSWRGGCSYYLSIVVAAFAVVLTLGSLRSYSRQMRSGLRAVSGDVGSSWYRPLVRN
jgi:hypothetical protein